MGSLASPLLAQNDKNIESVVAPPVRAMNAPKMWDGIGQINVPISTNDELVQKHVRQGFLLLHAQWDLEAYRHFAAALKREPDCLMAYCGVVLSLIHPDHEWKDYRARAINRMMTLAEHKTGEGAEAVFSFPTNERDYALAIGSLVVNGLNAGAASFENLKEKYPNDIQLSLLAPYLNRGGYDVFGNASGKQVKAVKEIKAVLDKTPNNPMVTNFYMMLMVEAPHNALNQKEEVLPYAKKLLKQGGDSFPGWQMARGYAAWRAGEMELARDSYLKAVSLYEVWKKESNADISDSDGLVRAYSFLAIVHFQMGNLKMADAVMAKLDSAKNARKTSAVYAYHDWRYDMMKVNMSLAAVADGDKAAIKTMLKRLPKINSHDKSKALVNKVIKAYQAYGLSKDYFHNGKMKESHKMSQLLAKIGEELMKSQADHRGKPYYSHLLILMQSLKVYRAEMLAELAGDEVAYGFYQEAIDKQLLPNRYFPPSVLYPLEYKLGQYYERKGDLKKARETYKIAIQRLPSHRASKEAYDKLMALLE